MFLGRLEPPVGGFLDIMDCEKTLNNTHSVLERLHVPACPANLEEELEKVAVTLHFQRISSFFFFKRSPLNTITAVQDVCS